MGMYIAMGGLVTIFTNMFPSFPFNLEQCLFVELISMFNIYHALFVVS